MRRMTLLHLSLLLALPLLVAWTPPSLPLPRLPSEAGKAADIATKTGVKAIRAAREMSDSEEHYLGRAVAARILGRYPLYQNPEATQYVNQVGQAVARKSSRPNTFRGYHFAVLDTGEANAFACPGGIILVTRGLVKTCANEDQLAAVLAHEVSHVANKDGLNSISQARWTEVLTTAGTETARQFGGGIGGSLVNLFEGAIDDVFKTIVVNGYSRAAEEAADRDAVSVLGRAGYNAGALTAILNQMSSQAGSGGLARTHPPTGERLAKVRTLAGESRPDPKEAGREQRFKQQKF